MLRLITTFLALAFLAGGAMAEDLSGIEWTTHTDDPPIGDPEKAIRGGTYVDMIEAYPLTFRLFGPNSNDSFAGWNRISGLYFGLLWRHPTTKNYIPCLATHWSVQDDKRTIYYKLDPDARWSDGKPITADDFVFAWKFLQRDDIVAPYYNSRMEEYFEEVKKLDDHTLKVVGKRPSWRPLDDYDIGPIPGHQVAPNGLENFDGAKWITDFNNVPPVVPGPYVIGEHESGQFVELKRLDEWWGDDKHYFGGMYNPDILRLRVVPDRDRGLDYLKKGEIDMYLCTTARIWAEETQFPAVKKGWVHRKRVFLDRPQGFYGMCLNLEVPVFQDKDFRKAVQYMLDFDEINSKLMHNAYYRQVSFFIGTGYENFDLKPYGFDPRKAREHLAAAGYRKRGKDGILVRDDGRRASFTLSYGSKGLERHMTVVKQKFKRFGVEMKLQLLEPGTNFANTLDRAYEACITGRTANMYPAPHQALHSFYVDKKNNNNIWGFGDARADSLIEYYRYGFDKTEDQRKQAIRELDAIVQDEAFYVPFWYGPYMRILYWDHIEWPDYYFPASPRSYNEWPVWWVNTEKQARLREAIEKDESLGEDTVVDNDPYGVGARLEAMRAASVGEGGGS